MKLSTTLGNNLLTHYNTVKIVCSPTLKSNVFTTAAIDNKDHNPSSTTAEGSFHGTGISLFQHPTMKNPGVERDIGKTNSLKRKLLQLPALYANVSPISDFKKEPEIPDYSTTEFSLLNNENQTDVEERLVVQIFICIMFNRFPANVTLLYPLKTSVGKTSNNGQKWFKSLDP